MKNTLFYMFLTTQNALFYKFQGFRMPYFTLYITFFYYLCIEIQHQGVE